MATTKTNSGSRRGRWTIGWTILWKTVRCGIIAYVVLVVLLLLFENRLVYPSDSWDPRVRFGVDSALQEVFFPAADGVKLHALFSPCDSPRVVILYLHGIGGNIAHRAGLLRFLSSEYDASVLGL